MDKCYAPSCHVFVRNCCNSQADTYTDTNTTPTCTRDTHLQHRFLTPQGGGNASKTRHHRYPPRHTAKAPDQSGPEKECYTSRPRQIHCPRAASESPQCRPCMQQQARELGPSDEDQQQQNPTPQRGHSTIAIPLSALIPRYGTHLPHKHERRRHRSSPCRKR